MKMPGRVTNVTGFGAFVDLGVQQDGLVHVSELADRFVKDPAEVVRTGQIVEVRVIGVDKESGRISLSMRSGREGRGGGRGKGGGRERKGRGRDARGRGERRPPRRRDEPRPEPAAPVEANPAPAGDPPAADVAPENPIPADMSEEEFMKRKMEELRRRFG